MDVTQVQAHTFVGSPFSSMWMTVCGCHACTRARAHTHTHTHLCGLALLVHVERQVVDVVKVLGQVAQNHLWVGALGQYVQQISRGHKVEAWEGDTLGLQVVLCVWGGRVCGWMGGCG